MKIKISERYDVNIYFTIKGEELNMLDEESRNYAINNLKFDSSTNKIYSNLGPGSQNIILIGLGEAEKVDGNILRLAAFKAAGELNKNNIKEASVHATKIEGICSRKTVKSIIEGLLQSEYKFDRYLSEKKSNSLERIGLIPLEGKDEAAQKAISEVETLVEGINLTRDLVNTPAIDMYPEVLARFATDNLEKYGVKVEVLGREDIEKLGMKAFLAVAEGSEKEPKFIIMKYLPEGDDKPAISLVGKGLTYDSGGYALKPADGMLTMKMDMAGSASVIGSIYAVAKNKINKNVVGIVAACENMISGGAYKNGDIISSMKGSSIEVINTDAEGRLTLADALYYAATKINSECIIDIATLTGACLVGLGEYTTGAITNDEKVFKDIAKSADRSGEYVWLLPSFPEMRELLKGDFADLKNSTGRFGGTITAGMFLEHFVEDTPWVHLDIAGPAYNARGWGYLNKGATGIPVKTLYNFVVNASK
ncbi:MAG: leucyl aminopeptidase [Tissierellia bacterium]|nr:leucyl aminopeptidase [Tissierellia bacterium]